MAITNLSFGVLPSRLWSCSCVYAMSQLPNCPHRVSGCLTLIEKVPIDFCFLTSQSHLAINQDFLLQDAHLAPAFYGIFRLISRKPSPLELPIGLRSSFILRLFISSALDQDWFKRRFEHHRSQRRKAAKLGRT